MNRRLAAPTVLSAPATKAHDGIEAYRVVSHRFIAPPVRSVAYSTARSAIASQPGSAHVQCERPGTSSNSVTAADL